MKSSTMTRVAIAATLLLFAGCGGGAATTASPSASASDRAASNGAADVDLLNQMCSSWKQFLDGLTPVDGFDPRHPDASLLAAYATYLDDGRSADLTAEGKLGIYGGDTPSSEYLDFAAAVHDMNANTQEEIIAASEGDTAAFMTAATAREEILARKVAAAQKLGADQCAW